MNNSNYTNSVKRVNLKEHAYFEAGRSGGQIENLNAHLNEILQGHLVDETIQIGLSEGEIRSINVNIEEAKAGIEKLDHEMVDIGDSQIPTIKNNIEQLQGRINRLKMGDSTEMSPEEIYNPLKFWVNLFFLFMLSAYLFVFYVSAVHSALFKNIGTALTSPNKVTAYVFSNIFNPNVFSEAGENIIFLVLAPFIFFGFGYAIHAIIESSYGKWVKILTIGFIILFTFLLDAGIAYKIHDSAQQALQMIMSPTEFKSHEMIWYKSVNFHIVLLMGFVTYIIWGVLLHTLLVEGKKKHAIQQKLATLSGGIRLAETKIEELSQRKSQIKQEINSLKIEVGKLEKTIKTPTLSRQDIELSIANFEVGWLSFLVLESQKELRSTCAEVVRVFRDNVLPNYNTK